MPAMTRQLSPQQVWALVAYLESLGGTVDVTAADIPAESAAPTAAAAPGGASFAGGSTDPQALIQAGGCLGCHMLDGQGGAVGPDLSRVGARRSATSLRGKILDPASSITTGYEQMAGVMPGAYGTQMNAAQLEALVRYLEARK
jgi:mono/diheme cytochrome c family protein